MQGNPLSARHLSDINKALSLLSDARQLADRMERAGQDVSEERLVMDVTEEQLKAVKREFFPLKN